MGFSYLFTNTWCTLFIAAGVALIVFEAWFSKVGFSSLPAAKGLFARLAIPVATLCAFLLGLGGAVWNADKTDSLMRAELLRRALQIAAALNPEDFAELEFSPRDQDAPVFERLGRHLKLFAAYTHERSVYTMAIRDGQIFFGPESLEAGDPLASAPGTRYERPPLELLKVLEDGRPSVAGPFSDEYGSFVTAYAPVFSTTGKVLVVIGVDAMADAWQNRLAGSVLAGLGISLFVMLVLVVGNALIRAREKRGLCGTGLWIHIESGISLVIGITLTAALVSVIVRVVEFHDKEDLFERHTAIARIVSSRLRTIERGLDSLVGLFRASEFVSDVELREFSGTLTNTPGLISLIWSSANSDQMPPVLGKEALDSELITRLTQSLRQTTKEALSQATIVYGKDSSAPLLFVRLPIVKEEYLGAIGALISLERLLIEEAEGRKVSWIEIDDLSGGRQLIPETANVKSGYSGRDDTLLPVPVFFLNKTYAISERGASSSTAFSRDPFALGAAILGAWLSTMISVFVSWMRRRQADLEVKVQLRTAELKETMEKGARFRNALAMISRYSGLVRGDLGSFIKVVVQSVARATDAGKFGVWLFDDDKSAITCVLEHDRRAGGDSAGRRIACEQTKEILASLRSGRFFIKQESGGESSPGLNRLGVASPGASCLYSSIQVHGRLFGFICFEGESARKWKSDEVLFAQQVSDQIITSMLAEEQRRTEDSLRIKLREEEISITLAQRLLDAVNGALVRHQSLSDSLSLFVNGRSFGAHAAGGDHYFAETFQFGPGSNEKTTVVSVNDQSGHEVGCILRSIFTDLTYQDLLRKSARPDLALIVEQVNRRLYRSGLFAEDEFVTNFSLAIDHATLQMQYVCCGHPSLVVIRGQDVIELPHPDEVNVPLGSIEAVEFRGGEFQLSPGDRILIVTDGVSEEFPEVRRRFPNWTLQSEVSDIVCSSDARGVSAILGEILKRRGLSMLSSTLEVPLVDDLTVVGIELEDIKQWQELEVTASSEDEVDAALDRVNHEMVELWKRSTPRPMDSRIKLVLEEALLNAWEHGNRDCPSRPITVRWRMGNDLLVEIIDRGPGFDPERVIDPRLCRAAQAERGRGIFILKCSTDFVRWEDRGRRLIFAIAPDSSGNA